MNELVSLDQIVSEIKFFENQAVVSYWEIGKRLNQAKEQVGHGNWLNRVKDNLGYSERTTQQLIKVSNSFSNPKTISDLNFSKVLALTSIKDEEERDDFIEKHDVESLTTRQLQEEIKEYKESLRKNEEEKREISEELKAAKFALTYKEEQIKEEQDKRSRAEGELLLERNRDPEIIEKEVIKEVVPEDYKTIKKELEKLEEDNRKLKDKLFIEKNKKMEAISQLEAEQAQQKIVEDVSGFHYRIAGFIKDVGGLLYLTEYIDELPARNKKLFLESIKYLRDFSEQLYKNVEENFKE
ncbi:DUF3102 domain-containing protein [uncultured Anaerococcus sp.]|uniref:DUF3102 domain-containing protein n=1 Tax=uncultured Anaerococcus sp. TaxID=293428 RepID=UPI00260F6A67|nr:DUF3102 domain-containing protein [uncultured Anaerococcus sp.]